MRMIAISGGKGGVGKTLVAINLAVALSKRKHKTILFDADLQLANLDIALNLDPEFNLQHVVFGERSLAEILTPGPAGIRVVTGGSAVNGLMNAGPKRMATFIGQFAELEDECDFLIFDTGAGLDQKVMTFLNLAEETILVTTPDPTSVTDAYATAKVLWKKKPDAQVSILVNQVQNAEEAQKVHRTLGLICQQYLQKKPGFLGGIRADLKAMESIRKRTPVVLSDPTAPASEDFDTLALLLSNPARVLAA